MEHIIHLLIGFIVLSFLLKTGFYPRWGIWVVSTCLYGFPYLYRSMATEQSPTEINSLLASAPHILIPFSICHARSLNNDRFLLQLFCRHLKTADTFPTDSYIHIEFLSRTANGGHTNLSAYTVVLRFSGSQLRTDHRHLFSCCFYTDIRTEPTLEKHSRRTEITT